MSTLAQLRDLVEADLDDSGNAVWATAELDRAFTKALREYNLVNPQQIAGTITVAAASREVSITTLTGLTRIVRVWHPYTAAAPEDPPQWRQWELWGTTLYILDGDEPAVSDVVRVYYHKPHTVEDLDSGTTTTVTAIDEEVLVMGAGAYAALEKSRSSVGQAGVSTDTPQHWLTWATDRLAEFKAQLAAIQRREAMKIDKRVPIQEDGWHRDDLRDGI